MLKMFLIYITGVYHAKSNVGAHFIKFDSLVDVGRIKRKCRGTEKITLSFSEPEWLIVLSDI